MPLQVEWTQCAAQATIRHPDHLKPLLKHRDFAQNPSMSAKYFDRYMFTTQVEYRLTLPYRIGLAGFAGVGEVIPGSSQVLYKGSHFLPDGGGPRFELSKKYHVNLRADFARGVDSWTWSVSLGEAF
jgi:hypothetical protein